MIATKVETKVILTSGNRDELEKKPLHTVKTIIGHHFKTFFSAS